MIIGIGVDTADIARFSEWHTYSIKTLSRIFSSQEIAYALKTSRLSAERFAVRFAAKEALTKAIRQTLNPECPLLSVYKASSVEKDINGKPYFAINWTTLVQNKKNIPHFSPKIHLSISHSKHIATAFVVIEETNMVDYL